MNNSASAAIFERCRSLAMQVFAGVLSFAALTLLSTQISAASAEEWRAIGHEPSWLLSRAGNEMTLDTDFGATRVSFAVPPATRVDDRTVSYATSVNGETLQLTVTTAVCVDTMTGMPRPEQVLLTLGDRRLQGCGGNPATLLQGHEWTVATLAGTPALAAPRITFTFGDDGRLSGLASCNRFGADYSLTGEGLSVGKGMSSMMACEPDIMKQEQLFMALLDRVSRFSIDADGALILHSDRDRTIVTARP